MIDLRKYNKFNVLAYNQKNKKYEIKTNGYVPKPVLSLLESFGLEKVASEFTTDFDFFIVTNAQSNLNFKNKFYGKPICRVLDITRYFTSGRQNIIPDSNKMHDYLFPMLLSKDQESVKLGYNLLLKELSYSDMFTLNKLIKLKIYPYTKIFELNAWNQESIYSNCIEILPLLKCALSSI